MARICQKGPEGAEEKVTRRRSAAELRAEALAASGALGEYVSAQAGRAACGAACVQGRRAGNPVQDHGTGSLAGCPVPETG